MALQDVCKWQASDTLGLSPNLPQAGGWAVPPGCDPQTFMQTHGLRLAHGTTTLAFHFLYIFFISGLLSVLFFLPRMFYTHAYTRSLPTTHTSVLCLAHFSYC